MEAEWLDLRAVSGVVQGEWLDLDTVRLIDWIPSTREEVEEETVHECVRRCVPKGSKESWRCGWRYCEWRTYWPNGQKVWIGLDDSAKKFEVRHWECHQKLVRQTVFP